MKKIRFGVLLCLIPSFLIAQKQILENSLDSFTNEAGNWEIVGGVTAHPFKDNDLKTSPGTGILANIHEHGTYGGKYELVSTFKHGDIDLEFDYMIAKGSNSGIYMQGNYEIQLYDSWGKKTAKYSDAGGIYERWDESKPEGQKGYEGYAPRVNAAKAPGLWQHMKISFQAPRFDANGKKLENAKILSIHLNGQLLHENVELSGVTRGALTEKEVAEGPLRFQGDHGSLAFRNIILSNFDQKPASLSNSTYSVSYAPYDPAADPSKLPVDATGELKELTWEFLKQPNEYAYTIKSKLTVENDGTYKFTQFSSSNNWLKIDGKEVIGNRYTGPNDERTGSIELKAGVHDLEVYSAKYDAWMPPALGLFVSGPGFRMQPLHAASSMIGSKPNDPIIVEAKTNTNLRSFMDFTENGVKRRIVHNINVGFPENIHFSYDLDKGALFQAWRGGFLNTTPMWDSRGDGSSRPLGPITSFSDEMFISNSLTKAWPKDSTGTEYMPHGYTLDNEDVPTFHYSIYGAKVKDKISVAEGKYFIRKVDLTNMGKALYAKIAGGQTIEKIDNGLYAVNNRQWYVKTNPDATLILRNGGQGQELIAMLNSGTLEYQIMY